MILKTSRFEHGEVDGITQAADGAVVVVFTHGWFHGKDWNDGHFTSFRQVLMHLAVREEERRAGSKRRVVGIYLAWTGAADSIYRLPVIEYVTFGDRLRARRGSVSKAA